MLNVVLFEPQIPQNTGNIARTCAVAHCQLHLIEPLGFTINDKLLRRAGLTYWSLLDVKIHSSFEDFLKTEHPENLWLVTKFAKKNHTEVNYSENDYLVFGRESTGLPKEIHQAYPAREIRIPMLSHTEARCLNLSTSVGIVVYEALRQTNFKDLV